jgi:Tfp pilus assembly protein PilF
MIEDRRQKRTILLISAVLVAATLVAYEPIRHNDFVMYDDDDYVVENPNVNGGITWPSVKWAFTQQYAANWHPLTWLSHMLDCEIYGLNPLGHHITNVLIHIVNCLLLFLLLSKMTGAVWRSAFVAAVLALHPVHVESVAWAAERKDVLSGLFWMLTILAYIRYTEQPNIKRYALVALAFAMGLMAKPMLVTLPFVLLLLDYWPLGRLLNFKGSILNLLLEKVPLLVLSALSCVMTLVAQHGGGAVVSLESCPLSVRVISALGCYFSYIAKMFYPKGLAVLYPPPAQITTDTAVMAIMGTVVLLALWGKGRRWLVVGLLWYIGTLVPVSGLVQVGSQIMADRYTYLPSIGAFIIVAWGAAEIFAKLPHPKPAAAAAAVAALIAMVLMTRIQVSYWRDSPTLFTRAIAVTKNNHVIKYNYGLYLCRQGQYEEGIRLFKESVLMCPEYPEAQQSICWALLAQKKFDEAIVCFGDALKERNDWPKMYMMYYHLGLAYEQKGDFALAETNYRKAITLNPNFVPAQDSLTSVLAKQGKTPELQKPKMNYQ